MYDYFTIFTGVFYQPTVKDKSALITYVNEGYLYCHHEVKSERQSLLFEHLK